MYGYEYGKAYETYSSSSSKKNPCGLNVSDEFTNSLTMRAMAEPYRSNVQSMRSRARAFRSSLAGLAR